MSKGLTKEKVIEISKIKQEPKWMLDFRLQSFATFEQLENPTFGPEIKINFEDIEFYKKVTDSISNKWEDVPKDVKQVFDKIGLPEAEQKYLAGVGAQFESEVIYHNMLQELEEKNVIFCDTDTALKKYPELFQEYFNHLVKYDENKYTALNGAVWSSKDLRGRMARH